MESFIVREDATLPDWSMIEVLDNYIVPEAPPLVPQVPPLVPQTTPQAPPLVPQAPPLLPSVPRKPSMAVKRSSQRTTLPAWAYKEARDHEPEPERIHASVWDGRLPSWAITPM